MWICAHCRYVTEDEANRYCGRCGTSRDFAGGTGCDLYLTGYNPRMKIPAIKVVREITRIGLKEAKDLVEGAPQPVLLNTTHTEADKLAARLHAVEVQTEICPHGVPPSVPVSPLPPSATRPVTGCAILPVVMGILVYVVVTLWSQR